MQAQAQALFKLNAGDWWFVFSQKNKRIRRMGRIAIAFEATKLKLKRE
jgi:hypothetical protein